MTDTQAPSPAPQLRTIETAVAGDGFLFDGKNWHHYVNDAISLLALLKENERLKAAASERGTQKTDVVKDAMFERLVEVHRGWCNYCGGNSSFCWSCPAGGCSLRDYLRAIGRSPERSDG